MLRNYGFLFFIFLLPTAFSHAQSAKLIGKSMNKALKGTSPKSVPIPGMEDKDPGLLGGTASLFSDAVGVAVGGTFKASKKVLGWSAKGLNPVQLTKIATSGSPFSTMLEMKGNNARKDFEKLMGDQLEKSGALDMLGDMEDVTGWDLPGNDKESFIEQLSDNTISALDKKGASLLKEMVN